MKPGESIMQFKIKSFRLFLLLVLSGLSLLGGMLPSKAELAGVGEPIPRNTRPGGSRGECDRPETFASLPALTILQPRERSQATTSQAFPTFLVYLPYELTANSPGRLVLETSGRELVHEGVFRSAPGNSVLVVSIPPESSKALQEGDSYYLRFRVYCNDPTMSNSTGLTARAEVQRARSNGAGNSWLDTLASAYSASNQTQWHSMLETEGLSNILSALSGTQQQN